MENGLNSCIFIWLKAFEFFPSGTRRTVLKMTFLKKNKLWGNYAHHKWFKNVGHDEWISELIVAFWGVYSDASMME